MKRLMITSLCVFMASGVAFAHWDVDDPNKMHYPQLPDRYGWDIDMTQFVLADDWKCTQSGPVEDIHFWYSVKNGDHLNPPQFTSVSVSIYSNISAPDNPYGDYSMPGELEWTAKVYGMSRESAYILVSVSIVTLIIAIALIVGWAHIRSRRKERMRY